MREFCPCEKMIVLNRSDLGLLTYHRGSFVTDSIVAKTRNGFKYTIKIDENLIRVGNQIGEYKVKNISENNVTINKNDGGLGGVFSFKDFENFVKSQRIDSTQLFSVRGFFSGLLLPQKGVTMKRMIFIGIVSALLGANFDKAASVVKSSGSIFEPTMVHEGTLTKVDGTSYTFNDGASFVIPEAHIKGMIPMNSKVRLCQGIWGSYYFETVR